MNSEEIFKLALNLSEPWQVKEVKLDKSEKELFGVLTISLDFMKGSKFEINGELCSAYDTEVREWRHLNFFEHKCYLKARVPRVMDKEGNITTVQVPWARSGSGFTLLFEAYAMLLIEQEMPVNKVAQTTRVTAPRIWRVFDHWVKRAVAEDKVDGIIRLGIDETSSRKGHNYVTVGVDLDSKRVIHVCEGKDSSCVTTMKDDLVEKGLNPVDIKDISIDMSPAFISGAMQNYPEAAITFDRFHVKKMLNEAFDSVRKLERVEGELLKGHKFTFLKSFNKLNAKKQDDLGYLTMVYPTLGAAYRLKVLFDDFWELDDMEESQSFLAFWCDMATESKIKPMIEFANKVKAHWSGIINYTKSKISSGIVEGINNKIQLAKRRARGYQNIDNFINMIYFLCAKLKFDYPHYPL